MKVMFKFSDGYEITKDYLMKTLLYTFIKCFGFKPPKSSIKIKFCYPITRKSSDGYLDEGFICVFHIIPCDGRLLTYHYNSIESSIERV